MYLTSIKQKMRTWDERRKQRDDPQLERRQTARRDTCFAFTQWDVHQGGLKVYYILDLLSNDGCLECRVKNYDLLPYGW